ncbi:hypothetical protein ACFL6T_03365 [Candidatus Zixiibacteriota bacterium]
MPADGDESPHLYHLYGHLLRSSWEIPSPELDYGEPDIELKEAAESFFSDLLADKSARRGWRSDEDDRFTSCVLSDGSDYLRWSGLFEFHVSSSGDVITCRSLENTPVESFQTYLLGHVLSWALLKQQVEQLHASVVEVDGRAIGFLGDSGFGKSTLSAAFLDAGYRLLTDDLLILDEVGDGFQAHPGIARIKLDPAVAREILGGDLGGVPMNPDTGKEVILLEAGMSVPPIKPVPVGALYILASPGDESASEGTTIKPLTPSQACVELIRNTFNTFIDDPVRLQNQFNFSTRVAERIPVKMLSYPRRLDLLPQVIEMIIAKHSD